MASQDNREGGAPMGATLLYLESFARGGTMIRRVPFLAIVALAFSDAATAGDAEPDIQRHVGPGDGYRL